MSISVSIHAFVPPHPLSSPPTSAFSLRPRLVCVARNYHHRLPQLSLKAVCRQPSHQPCEPAGEQPLSLVKTVCTTLAISVLILASSSLPSEAKNLLTDNTIYRRYLVTDSSAILRYSLTLPSERANDPQPAAIRLVQEYLEKLGVHQRNGGVAGLIASRRDVADLKSTLVERQLDVLLDVPASRRKVAAQSLAQLETSIQQLSAELGDSGPVIGENFLPTQAVRAQQTLRDAFAPRNSLKQVTNYDVAYLETLRTEALSKVSDIEELAVQGSGPSFRIPRRYNNLPRLLGRARVELELEKKQGVWQQEQPSKTTSSSLPTSGEAGKKAKIKLTVDGYAAPLTGGNFIDLVQRKWYDGMKIVSGQRDFYLQFGTLQNDAYVDLKSGTARQLPLEIMVNGEPQPVYGATLDEAGIGDLSPTLPVTAFGAVAMIHSVENANDASAPFYIFTLDPSSYQARSVGGSVLTGSVATFAYVTEGKQLLNQLEPGDLIVNAKVVDGMDYYYATGDR